VNPLRSSHRFLPARHEPGVRLRLLVLVVGMLLALAPVSAGLVDRRIFLPTPMPTHPTWVGTPPAEVVAETPDGLRLLGYWWPPTKPGAPVLIFFHGQSGNRFEAATMASALASGGEGLLIASYRGYGDNPGKPSEAGLYADGDAFVALARRLAPDARLYVCGFSLGSAVALHAGAADAVSGVVTIGAFTRVADLAPALFRGLVGARFDNLAQIRALNKPVLLIHGTADQVVPIDQATRLRAAAPDHARLLTLPGAPHRLDFAQLAPILWDNVAQMPR